MDPNKEDNYLHIPADPSYELKCGIGEYIFNKMKENGNSVAQIDCVTGKVETYASMLSRCVRTAQSMQAKGLVKGDIVSLCSFNNMDYAVTIVASYFIGVLMAPLDPTAALPDIIHCLKLIKPKILFCETHNEDFITEAIQTSCLECEITVFGQTKAHTPFSQYLISEQEELFKPVPPNSIAETGAIHFSSGTTGLPKAVCVNQYSLYLLPLPFLRTCSDYKVILTITNPYWMTNLMILHLAIVSNCARVIYKAFNENTLVKVLQDYQVNLVVLTPTNCNRFIKNPALCQYDTGKLKHMIVGGSPFTPRQHLELERLFPSCTVYDSYGATECGGFVLMPVAQDQENLLTRDRVTIGTLIPGYYYKVVNLQTGEVLGPNETGELCVKSSTLMRGYYERPDLTAEAYDNEGYFKTGDVVYYDEEYKFYYVDRLKEIFKYKGWHISPTIIETTLITHPDVKECTVFGTPDALDGEVPTAAVVLRENVALEPEQIMKYISELLSDRYHLRGGVFILDKLPRTPSDKVKRHHLRQVVMQMMDRN